MRYMKEFRDPALAERLANAIAAEFTHPARVMEFCGGHTISILKYNIHEMLPDGFELVSGPGCPVCVTSRAEVDCAIRLALTGDVILASFGDMLRVPGTESSLLAAKAEGADVRIVYSPDDAVRLAMEEPEREVVFFGVGFEATAPVTAASIKLAEAESVKNYSVLSAHKATPPILEALKEGELALTGFVCPGHVTAITGTSIYGPLKEAGKNCVVSGFEPVDILASLLRIIRQMNRGEPEVEIEYDRVVKPEGNITARTMLREVFKPVPAIWRGIGLIPDSGMEPGGRYEEFSAINRHSLTVELRDDLVKGCVCGEILRGLKKPTDCALFGTGCHPENPVGACMVSEEGACSIYYRFKGNKDAT